MSVKSMTAFGYGEHATAEATYRCELKSLNSRYMEVGVRLPRHLSALETEVIGQLKAGLARGKIDVVIDVAMKDAGAVMPRLNTAVFNHYLNALSTCTALAAQNPHAPQFAPPAITDLLRLEGVWAGSGHSGVTVDHATQHRDGVCRAVATALGQLIESRQREGQALKEALVLLASEIGAHKHWLLGRADDLRATIYQTYKKRLQTLAQRLEEPGKNLIGALPEERILAELIVLTDRADVAEELTRLDAHVVEFQKALEHGDEVGRRLDFLCQELHREVNTLGNKLMQGEVGQVILTMKQNIERLRQQVQNIE